MNNKDKAMNENNNSHLEVKESRAMVFFKKHNTVIMLVLVIIIIIIWALIKMNSIEKTASDEKQQLKEVYQEELEKLSISSMEMTSRVFTWAIRGEMLRQNMDQVNQFFNSFIQEPGVTKLHLIDPVTAIIILSTDKKDEGTVIENTLILQAERTYHIAEEGKTLVISPVMGLNERIGILVIEYNSIAQQ